MIQIKANLPTACDAARRVTHDGQGASGVWVWYGKSKSLI